MLFKANEAKSWGGAVTSFDTDIRCLNSKFINNFVNGYTGGAVAAQYGKAYFEGTLFLGNSCQGEGSGLYLHNNTTAPLLQDSVINCVFDSNQLTQGNGALRIRDAVLMNSLIINNQSSIKGASLWAKDSKEVINCTVEGNSTNLEWAAVESDNCTIVNTTITGNTSQNGESFDLGKGQTTFRNVTVTGTLKMMRHWFIHWRYLSDFKFYSLWQWSVLV